MKRKYLTVYDYQTGGVWQYITANKREQIEEKYPKLTVVDNDPDWISRLDNEDIREYDIDDEPDEFMSRMMIHDNEGNKT